MNNSSRTDKTRRMTGIAILSATIIVLQILSNFVKFGPVSITLSLAPIIIGAAIYGTGAGATLGFVFSAVVVLTGILGWDGGFIMLLMGINPLGCVLVCLLKGVAAGFFAGLCYELIAKKNDKLGVLISGIVCPVVNTGLFIVGMLVFFFDTLSGWAGGQNLLLYIIVGLTGVNFLVELAVNIVLSSGITRIIRAGKKMH